MLTDLAGFTKLVERSDPSEVTRLLNLFNYRNRVVSKRDLITAMQHYRGLRLNNGESAASSGDHA